MQITVAVAVIEGETAVLVSVMDIEVPAATAAQVPSVVMEIPDGKAPPVIAPVTKVAPAAAAFSRVQPAPPVPRAEHTDTRHGEN